MTILRKRIRTIERYTRFIPSGNDVVIGAINPSPELLLRLGFSNERQNGETILPTPVGPVSLFNAEGKTIKHKDQPMETDYRTVHWRWTEWHGKDRVEKTDFRDVPYKRYPRSMVPPPALELTLTTDVDGNKVVRTPLIKNWRSSRELAIHAVNLILEIFGDCIFYGSDMKRLIEAPVKKLNWRILPPGQRPFHTLKQELTPILNQVQEGNRAFTEHRLETINGYHPDFAAIGHGGFSGYVVLGFKAKNLFVLESLFYGNATYVLGEKWEELSKLTKAQILNQGLQHERFIHLKGWDDKVQTLLS